MCEKIKFFNPRTEKSDSFNCRSNGFKYIKNKIKKTRNENLGQIDNEKCPLFYRRLAHPRVS